MKGAIEAEQAQAMRPLLFGCNPLVRVVAKELRKEMKVCYLIGTPVLVVLELQVSFCVNQMSGVRKSFP